MTSGHNHEGQNYREGKRNAQKKAEDKPSHYIFSPLVIGRDLRETQIQSEYRRKEGQHLVLNSPLIRLPWEGSYNSRIVNGFLISSKLLPKTLNDWPNHLIICAGAEFVPPIFSL